MGLFTSIFLDSIRDLYINCDHYCHFYGIFNSKNSNLKYFSYAIKIYYFYYDYFPNLVIIFIIYFLICFYFCLIFLFISFLSLIIKYFSSFFYHFPPHFIIIILGPYHFDQIEIIFLNQNKESEHKIAKMTSKNSYVLPDYIHIILEMKLVKLLTKRNKTTKLNEYTV